VRGLGQLPGVRVLVTGAAGFVGGHLLPALTERGHEVVATDREVDVADAAAVEACVTRAAPDAIVHLAAQSSVALSGQEPLLTYRVNFLGARAVLLAATRAPRRPRVLLVGSGEQYGVAAPGGPPFDEGAPLRPRSPYARTKACADLLAAAHAAAGLDVVRTRSFNHTGPGQADVFVASSFARQAVEIAAGRRAPRLWVGNLDSVRDFLDVADVVDAYARLLEPTVPAGVYNVASGEGLRIGDLLATILDLADIRPEVTLDPARLRPTDHAVGDSTRLRNVTGWRPRVPLRDALRCVIADWQERSS
jgi:GDP-4-dehydro-6-deoxy-D-mannose reductase